MKKTRILLSLMLAATMLMGTLTACTGADETSSSQTASSSSPATVSEPASETTDTPANSDVSVVEEPTADAEASTVEGSAVEGFSYTEYPLTEETETLTAYAPIRTENSAVVNEFDDWLAIQKAEEITNVTVEWQSIPEAQYQELCPIMVASGDYADMLFSLNQGYAGGTTKAFSEDVILDLASYIHDYAPNYCARVDEIDRGWSQVSTDSGQVLALYSLNSDSNAVGVLIRSDWLADLNLEVPETVDEFVDMLYAFQDAYNVAPLQFSSATQEGNLFTSAYDVSGYQVSIFGSGSYWYQVDGTVKCSLVEDGYKSYLTLINQLYQDNIFSRDFASFSPASNDNAKNALISNGTVGVITCNDSQVDAYTDMISEIDGASWTVAANPTLQAGEKIHFGNYDLVATGSTMASISSTCSNVELALQWLDFWYSDQGMMLFNYGVEGDTYTMEDGMPVYTDKIENNEWGIGYSSAVNTYCPIGNIPSYGDIRRYRQYYSDETLEAIEVWSQATDLAYVMPKVSLTDEESEIYNGNVSDIETYAQESILSFIVGTMSIETQWEEYVNTLISMGLNENMEIYQAALDRMG